MRLNIYKKVLKKISIGFLVLFFPLGFFIAKKLNNNDVVMYFPLRIHNSPFRNIASVGQNLAIPSSLILQAGKLSSQSQHDFVKASSVITSNKNTIEFYLARFLVSTKEETATLVCQKYHQVDIVFKAYSHSIHGHVPQMVLKARCKAGHSHSAQLGPFHIPKKQILSSPISQQLFSSPSAIGRQVLLFSNVGISWPVEWVLSELKLSGGQEGSQNFIITFASPHPKDYFIVYLK